MHYLLLVTLTMGPGSTSADARDEVHSRLMEDDSFCGEGGRFGSPLCDWFVIGGRWSGTLQQTVLGKAYETALNERFPETAGMLSTRWIEQHSEALNQLWQQSGGTGPNPLTRDNYASLGYEDDAMLVNQTLYEQLLAKHAGDWRDRDSGDCHFTDLDCDQLDESCIGRKWLVVVDYHS